MQDVRLRPVEADDWARIHEWAASERACRYQTWGPNEPAATRQFVAEALAAWQDPSRARRVWAAEADELGVVGIGELKIRSHPHLQAEIAYAVHVDLWGQGYGAAIARALVETALAEGMHRIFGTCDPRNEASRRVLQKAGLRYEGTLRHTVNIRDGWRDSAMYALVAPRG